jgi:hypothetical protein
MKKKIFLKTMGLTLLFALALSQGIAQPVKGTLLTETSFGNIGFGNNNYENKTNDTLTSRSEGSNFNFDLYPRFGIFLTDKLAVGTELEVYFYNSHSTYFDGDGIKSSEYKSNNTSLGIYPFARYYFKSSDDGKSMFFGQLSGGYYFDLADNSESNYFDASGTLTGSYVYDYKNYHSINGSLELGWNRFISENVALNLNLGYRYSKSFQTYTYTSTWGGISTLSDEYKYSYGGGGLTWSMGFTMFIPCKKTVK